MIKPILTSLGVSSDGKTVTLKDSTGAYNNPNNLGGYGAPNAAVPTKIGVRWRYWADDLPYANKVITDNALITALLGAGYGFKTTDLGLADGIFTTGVHQVKYYPLETINSIVTLTKDSKKITVTAGAQPSTYSADYAAIVIFNGGNAVSQVLLIDKTQPLTNTEFYVDQAWTDPTVAGYSIMIATEADLKVLVTAAAEKCLAQSIGAQPSRRYCDQDEINNLSMLLGWVFASKINFDCSDYSSAHNLIVSVEKQCSGTCATVTSCKTCSK